MIFEPHTFISPYLKKIILLKYNLHIIEFTHLKYEIQWFLADLLL